MSSAKAYGVERSSYQPTEYCNVAPKGVILELKQDSSRGSRDSSFDGVLRLYNTLKNDHKTQLSTSNKKETWVTASAYSPCLQTGQIWKALPCRHSPCSAHCQQVACGRPCLQNHALSAGRSMLSISLRGCCP